MNFFIDYIVEQIPVLSFYYLDRIGNFGKENFELMDKFKKWIQECDLKDNNLEIITMSYVKKENNLPSCHFEVGVINTKLNKDFSSRVKHKFISGGKFLTFTLTHNTESIVASWQNFEKETSRIGFQIDKKRIPLERYNKRLVDIGQCEFLVPIL